MCFNGKKNLQLYNAGMKRKLQEYLRILQTSDMLGADGVMRLEVIRSKLINSPANFSHKVGIIDYKVLRYLEDAQQDIIDSSSRAFDLRMRKIREVMAGRDIEAKRALTHQRSKEEIKQDKIVAKRNKKLDKKYASNPNAFLAKEVTIDELYSTDDLMLLTVSRLQDEVDSLTRRAEELGEQFMENPEDYAVKYELQQTQSTLEKRRVCQKMITAQAVREHAYELFETIEAQDKVKISKRKIEDDQYELLRKKAEKILQNYGMSNATVSSATAESAANASAAQAPVTEMPAAETVTLSPAMQKKRLEKAKAECEKMRLKLQDKAEAYAEELPMVERDLLRLLEKRKSSTASQCLILDMNIDELKVQRNNILDAVKRIRQNITIIDERLPIINAAMTSGEMKTLSDKMSKMLDLSDLAVSVADLTQEGNESLIKAKTDHMVAGSVGVDISSSVSETPDTVTVGEKDENKYADLEAELKRTMGENNQ